MNYQTPIKDQRMETDESSDTESSKEENTRMAEGRDRSGTSADTDTDAVAESFKCR